MNLDGKKVLVTGGSKGIGFEIAKAFVSEGAEVSIVGRTKKTLEEANQNLKNKLSIYSADLTKESEREKLIRDFMRDHGRIDVLVNNAGGSIDGSASETPLVDYYNAFEINFFSAVHLSKLVVAQMKIQKSGSIINITSIFGRESGGSVTYNTAKAALISYTKSLANDVAAEGIRVNSIAPGSVLHDTGNWKKRLEENPEAIKSFIDNEIPAGRFGTPEEIANVAVFLASERSSWVLGASLNVDGGQSRMNF